MYPDSFYRKKLVVFKFEHNELSIVDPHERRALMGIIEKN